VTSPLGHGPLWRSARHIIRCAMASKPCGCCTRTSDAIGANPKAAELNGIPVRRYTVLAFVASGVLTAAAGIVLASRLRVGQASVGLEFLLPALVGVFLGSTTIKPGRFSVWGTLVGVAILAIGISGIEQLGGEFWVEPFFNGATLVIAIAIAGYTQRRRVGSQRLSQTAIAAESKGGNVT